MKLKIHIFCFLVILIFVIPCNAQISEMPDSPYQPGENLQYVISYGFITGGKASIILEKDTLLSDSVYHFVVTARTTGIADLLYRVHDTYESYVNPDTDLPLKAIRNIREGNYRKYNEVVFDHVSHPDSSIVHSQSSGIHIVPKNIHDIISGFYYFRKYFRDYKFKKGELIQIQTYFTDELWPLRIRYAGNETLRTKMGKVNCVKFNPVTEVGRVFMTEEDMSVWFSKDNNFLPVKIRFEMRIGAVKIDLVEYEKIKYEFESLKVKKKSRLAQVN
jgi:hypothetical protein